MTTETTPHPIAEEPPSPEWRGIVLRTVAVLAVLVGVYTGLAYYFGDRVPRGTTVEGVDIGALSRGAAEDVLVDKLDGLMTAPVVLSTSGEPVRLDPAQAGLTPDYGSTLDGLTGLTFDPRNLWSRVSGDGRDLDLEVDVDEDALRAAVADLAPEVAAAPVEAEVVLTRGEVRTTLPEAGHALDVEETASSVRRAWPKETEVAASVTGLPPVLSAEQVQAFVADVVEPALAGPVIVVVGDAQARITPNQLARLLSVEQLGDTPGEGSLRLLLDETGLTETVEDGLAGVVREPQDASVRLGEDGRPQVRPAVPGARLDDAAVLAGVRQVLAVDGAAPGTAGRTDAAGTTGEPEADAASTTAGPGTAPEVAGRTVAVQTIEVEPQITDEDAQEWDVDQVMAEFVSQFPTGPANAGRTENIRVGLTYVNGAVVMPGEQFSLADTLAPISPDRGYVQAGVISDGRLVQGLGGGLSQVSTALLNTAWSAGVRLDSFTPHSYYISRYPEGREATISIGAIDNTWTNDTDSPVVIQTFIQGDVIVMRFWGDRQYTVDTTTSPRSDISEPDTFDDDSPDCLDQGAVEGFTVTVTRTLSRAGDVVRSEAYTTTYQPSPGVTCTGDEAGKDDG